MAQRGWEMVRYADDFVILCESQEEAQRGSGRSAAMGGASGTDPAPDQNAHRGCEPSWEDLTFWGITSSEAIDGRARRAWRSSKKPSGSKTQRTALWRDESKSSRTSTELSRGWFGYFKHSIDNIFQTVGPMDTRTTAQHPAQTAQGKRACSRDDDHQTMAKCLLRRTRVNLLSLNPSHKRPTAHHETH